MSFLRILSRNVLVVLVASQLALPVHLVGATVARGEADAPREQVLIAALQEMTVVASRDPQLSESLAGLEAVAAELEQADENTYPRDIPDPFHLTQQYLLVTHKDGKDSDRYHLAGTSGGLPKIIPQPDALEILNLDGSLAFRYKRGEHVIESVKPAVIAYDAELLVVIDVDGNIYTIDLSFARRELFKAPVPVHQVMATVTPDNLASLQMNFVTRGFRPFTHLSDEEGGLHPIDAPHRFTAGDIVLWQEKGDKRVLIDILTRDFIVTEINNGNYLLGSLAYSLRSDKPQQLGGAVAIEKEQGQQLDAEKFAVYRDGVSAEAKQVLQSMDAERMQRIILNDVRMNSYRDEFTYTSWQRDYLLLKTQAESIIKDLEKSVNAKYKVILKDVTAQNKLNKLKEGLRKDDLSNSWIMLSELYTEDMKKLIIDRIAVLRVMNTSAAKAKITVLEKILRENDYERLWNEPQLVADVDMGGHIVSPFRLKIERFRYQHLHSGDLQRLAANILGLTSLAAVGGAAWMLKAGLSLRELSLRELLKQKGVPVLLREKNLPVRNDLTGKVEKLYNKIRKGARKRAIIATVAGLALIPAVGVISHLAARSTGQDWDFKKQLTLMGIRTYAFIALPLWHHLANWTGQTTLIPALAAQVSPLDEVKGNSPIGKGIGLQSDETIAVGLRNPLNRDTDSEVVRRRAISAMQQQRVRAQGLGWEIAAYIIGSEYLLGKEQPDMQELTAKIDSSQFKDKWKKLAVGLQEEVYQLYRGGVFPDLHTVSHAQVYNFLQKTKPQVFTLSYYDGIARRLQLKAKRSVSWLGKGIATVATDETMFLQVVDPDDFVSSMVWHQFWTDFLTVVLLEGTYGARTKANGNAADIKQLFMSGKRPPYWHRQHMEALTSQVYAYSISVQGRTSLIFQMLKRIEESNYRPLEELLVAGKDNHESFFGSIADVSKNAIDLRNVDYGRRYMDMLRVMVVMLQAGLAYDLLARRLLVKVNTKTALYQWLFYFIWAQWAFGWPWTAFYSVQHLREAKMGSKNVLFMQAKVQLKKAIDQEDAAELEEGYNALVGVYSDVVKETPPSLVRAVVEIEAGMRVAEEDLLSAADLTPYMGLVAQIANTNDIAVKRAIYRRLVELVKTGEDYAVSKEEAEHLLHFAMLNPPFPTEMNSFLKPVTLFGLGIVTTLMASKFHRKTYELKTLRGIAPWVGKGLAIYALVWLLLSKDHVLWAEDFIRKKMGWSKSKEIEH